MYFLVSLDPSIHRSLLEGKEGTMDELKDIGGKDRRMKRVIAQSHTFPSSFFP